ncbi:MAG: hypothetical protein RhofKO_00530 [Rhodothermales bacterium]
MQGIGEVQRIDPPRMVRDEADPLATQHREAIVVSRSCARLNRVDSRNGYGLGWGWKSSRF